MKRGRDAQVRSVVKSITWRFLATVTTMVLVYIFTGSLSLALGIGAIEVVVKIIIYYLHERVWDGISWKKGRAEY